MITYLIIKMLRGVEMHAFLVIMKIASWSMYVDGKLYQREENAKW